MPDRYKNHCAAVFDTHQEAEMAIKALGSSGFDITSLSIIGRDYHTEEHAVGFVNTKDSVRYAGRRGAFWGALLGVLFAPAFFFIPGVGPILTGGIVSSAIMGAIEGGAVGAAALSGVSALVAGLVNMGVPKDSVIAYETEIKADRFLVLAHGSPTEVAAARDSLQALSPRLLDTHV